MLMAVESAHHLAAAERKITLSSQYKRQAEKEISQPTDLSSSSFFFFNKAAQNFHPPGSNITEITCNKVKQSS